MVLPNFEQHLQKYAKLLVAKGINVQPGDWVKMTITVDQAPLARLIVKEAYALGAENVIVVWSDDEITKQHYLNQPEEVLTNIPDYKIAESEDHVLNHKVSRLSILSSDPGLLNDVDPGKVAAYQNKASKAYRVQRIATQNDDIKWTVAAAAGAGWAAQVFPDLATSEEQVDALWDQIFKTCRVYADDPVAAWDEHKATLDEKAAKLNEIQFDALHYTAPGTDLTLGLPKNHIWASAGSTSRKGEEFIANMPTEEVFTAPDTHRMDGVVRSTKPLSYAGTLIEGIEVHFKDGKIVDISAEKGDEAIKKLVHDNEGATGLGEVALVPDPSPISQSGITFFNTLFDENASNHLAIGAAYPTTIQGGTEMSQEELLKHGMNTSDVHVDFMIGSAEMNVDGIKEDGTIVPIFRNGDWAI
ncbi:aminopeptidase [Bacillus ginsengihumi]|uniref:Aminopeptidase n=1 Tax=Heyndrickxia ginsengihumi TaxID=363870 RepID=A0A0A6Y1U1_9BACI|nr:aminopeptidase [Heyndrickxia ginsengihumi]KHD86242.1 peptidase M29 [Heyndrickxia ginsengihumi]MBE6184783.1 aminopeptidase [Bacillus sp. (in: firmicutes)]MCM3024430.1 aminopeptidase [Heyndrickxia ginsengihumi]NEY20238.1 aminopeptidase [Heyndrickxia ginsengihumi]